MPTRVDPVVLVENVTAKLLLWFAGLILISDAPAQTPARIDYAPFLQGIRVPPGFTIGLAAGSPAIVFPMFACFDEEGRLYVAESSGKDLYGGLKKLTRDCRVSRLEDADGD